MAESKLREELEEQEFPSFYRVDVYMIASLYALIDSENTDNQKYFTFSEVDYFAVRKSYSVYTLDQKQVFERVKKAVEEDEDSLLFPNRLYTIRVYQIPLDSRVIDDDDEDEDITVFNSKGEMVVNSEREIFKVGEIVEYHDLNKDVVRLAIVYRSPKIEEVCKLSEDSDNELSDQYTEHYALINLDKDWFFISASYVSRPSFPVADAFKDAFKEKFGDVFEDLDFDDLSELM